MKLLRRPKGKLDELSKIEQQIEASRKKRDDLILKRAEMEGTPDSWIPTDNTLAEVRATESEYWDVAEHLQASMPDAHVSNLWRVQNLSLWSHYTVQKERLETTGSCSASETKVFLGTSCTDPGSIYNSQRDGCMMQAISKNGFWG
jgi:hypothetical protein